MTAITADCLVNVRFLGPAGFAAMGVLNVSGLFLYLWLTKKWRVLIFNFPVVQW